MALRVFSSGAAESLLRRTRKRSARCMPRSGNWLWPTIFCHESSSRGPASGAQVDWAGPSRAVDRRTVPPLSVSRSSFYDEPSGETEMNRSLMQLIDRQFLDTPFYGVRR